MEERDGEGAAAWDGDPPLDTKELALDDGEERLPWLESGDDENAHDEGGGRMFAFVVGGLAVLLALVGGIWWATHRGPDPALYLKVASSQPLAAHTSHFTSRRSGRFLQKNRRTRGPAKWNRE